MSQGDDMYKAILKEIGAEESYMDYLFDESDEEDIRRVDKEGNENDLVEDETREFMAKELLNDNDSDDVHVLHQWESDAEDNVVDDPYTIKRNADSVQPSTAESFIAGGNISGEKQQNWKQMLLVATAKQEQLMGQMINLQIAQKESSPRNKMKSLTSDSERAPTEEGDEISASSPVVLKEINDNDPNLNSSIPKISKRNAKLQDQWQSQQAKSARLQDKLSVMHTNFYNQQELWQEEQRGLFSPAQSPPAQSPPARSPPAQSPTKIPRWNSLTSTTKSSSVAETPRSYENKAHGISPKNSKQSSQELEDSKALILQLKAQLEESQKIQQSQRDEISDYKNRLEKRDVELYALLLRYETEQKSWNEEIKEKQAHHLKELQSRDADLEDARLKLHEHIAINKDLKEQHLDELKELSPNTFALHEELKSTQNELKSEIEENMKKSAFIQELKDENNRLKSDLTRQEEFKLAQDEIKSQMKVAIQEQTKRTRQFQSRIRELEGRHAEELKFWKTEVDDHRRQIGLNSSRMESQLVNANARFAELERKHDKEVKEWQHLLDADITKAIDESGFENHDSMLKENENNLMAIGASSTSAELLSPIRKAPSMRPQQINTDGAENSHPPDDSSSDDSGSNPSESMNMIDDLLQELGEMNMERAAILKEINDGDTGNISHDLPTNINSSATSTSRKQLPKTGEESEENNLETQVDREEEPPKPLESPHNSWEHEKQDDLNESDASNDSEVLDETLHLLNNLKTMLKSHEDGKEHETTVIERLEVLSELMQSQDQPNTSLAPVEPSSSETPGEKDQSNILLAPTQLNTSETHGDRVSSSTAPGDETLVTMSASRAIENQSSLLSTVEATAATNPWPALVAELRNRCEFLERDRDEVTRITEQILEMERAAHKVELEAAIATAERKANETLHRIQLESNQEMNDFYRNVCFQCQHEAFDYSYVQEDIDE